MKKPTYNAQCTAQQGYFTCTSSERATYQALRARGYSHDDAMEDALDGVDVDTVRQSDRRTEQEGEE